MFLEITNDIHLGLKFGCCNTENRKLLLKLKGAENHITCREKLLLKSKLRSTIIFVEKFLL